MYPTLLNIGEFPIQTFSFLCAIGTLLSTLILQKNLKLKGVVVSKEQISTLLIFVFLGALIGGRIGYIILHTEQFEPSKTSALELVKIWQGGGETLGGILGGVIVLYLYCLWQGTEFLKYTDAFALPVTFIQIFASIGNFMSGESYGEPTSSGLGVIFPYGPASIEFPGFAVHPNMLYEATIYAFIGWVLFTMGKIGFKTGFISSSFVLLNSIELLSLSFFTIHFTEINGFQVMPLFALFAIAITVMVILRHGLYEKG